MPESKTKSSRGRLRRWVGSIGAWLRQWIERVLRIAVGKPMPVPPPAQDPPPAPQKPAPPPSRESTTAAPPSRESTTAAPRTPPRAPSQVPAGTWLDGRIRSMLGRLDLMPLAPPARDYRLYEPASMDESRKAPTMLIVLHGCRQDADDIAIGTRLNEHADERGWRVLYPQQTNAANKWNCWNWFDPATVRGHGETALVVAMHDEVALRRVSKRPTTRPDTTPPKAFLAGMSAGGALASILALRHPERWAAVAVHSGLPYGAAEDPFTALKVMKEGAKSLAAARTLRLRSHEAPGIPALVLHGSADDIVDRRNADLLVRQFLGWNGYFGDDAWDTAELPPVDDEHVSTVYGHPYVLRRYERKGLAPVHECEVIGMGHAWAGGDASLPYHDELGPDASALMVEFFATTIGAERETVH